MTTKKISAAWERGCRGVRSRPLIASALSNNTHVHKVDAPVAVIQIGGRHGQRDAVEDDSAQDDGVEPSATASRWPWRPPIWMTATGQLRMIAPRMMALNHLPVKLRQHIGNP